MENVKWWVFFCLFLCLFCFVFVVVVVVVVVLSLQCQVKVLDRQIYLACSTDVGIQIVGSAQHSTHLNVWNRLSDTRRKLTRLTQVVVVVIILN